MWKSRIKVLTSYKVQIENYLEKLDTITTIREGPKPESLNMTLDPVQVESCNNSTF